MPTADLPRYLPRRSPEVASPRGKITTNAIHQGLRLRRHSKLKRTCRIVIEASHRLKANFDLHFVGSRHCGKGSMIPSQSHRRLGVRSRNDIERLILKLPAREGAAAAVPGACCASARGRGDHDGAAQPLSRAAPARQIGTRDAAIFIPSAGTADDLPPAVFEKEASAPAGRRLFSLPVLYRGDIRPPGIHRQKVASGRELNGRQDGQRHDCADDTDDQGTKTSHDGPSLGKIHPRDAYSPKIIALIVRQRFAVAHQPLHDFCP